MKQNQKARRGMIIGSYVFLLTLVSLFEYCRIERCIDSTYIVVMSVAFLAYLLCFIPGFISSRAWHFSHRSFSKLDEREMQLINRSMRLGYSLTSIIILITLMIYAVTEINISMILVAGLIMMAHMIPTSIVGWIEKEF